MSKVYLTQERIYNLARPIARELYSNIIVVRKATNAAFRTSIESEFLRLYGVPRGGIPAAYAIAHQLAEMGAHVEVVDDPGQADVLVDDIVDSGATRKRYAESHPGVPFVALVHKSSDWVVFPWEGNEKSDSSADDIPLRLLEYIGEDASRSGLVETPKRFLKAWDHWTSGYRKNPADVLKVFEDGAGNYDEMVVVRDIPVYSKCEHHLADIFGVAHVAYIPNGRICGLSKLSRIVDIYARRLQVQERLTVQVADSLMELLEPLGVAVMLRCRHMCMESRGVCQQGHTTITTALRGKLQEAHAKAEFLSQVTS